MSTTIAPPRRRRRWLVLPLSLLALLLVSGVWLYVRGTRLDSAPTEPEAVGEPVATLTVDTEGRPQVWSAILLPHPAPKVWRLVTDYAHYDRLLPYLRDIRATPEPDGCRMRGDARSASQGWWAFDITIRESKRADQWQALWDQKDDTGEVQVNRGGWTVVPRGPNQTLLVLTLEAQVRGYPTWVLRNFFLRRLPHVLQTVAQDLNDRSSDPE